MSAIEEHRRMPPRLRRFRAAQRVAAGLDLVAALRKRDIARSVVSWADLVRG